MGGGAVIILGLVMTTLTERGQDDGWGPDQGLGLGDGKGVYAGVNGEGDLDVEDMDIGPGAGSQVDGWVGGGHSQQSQAVVVKSGYGGVAATARPRRSPSPVGGEDCAYLLRAEAGGAYL